MKKIVVLIFIGIISSSLFCQIKQPTVKELDYLKSKLETLAMEDQLFRRLYLVAEEKFGKDSDEMEYFWKVVEEQDKRIENELIIILDTYGWLGINAVGRYANSAQWSILQHGSLQSKEKYAPLLNTSVLSNESQSIHYARLIDRILVNDNKPQRYGSQIFTDEKGKTIFFKIADPEYVDKRRNEIGLDKISNFARENGIEWTIIQKDN